MKKLKLEIEELSVESFTAESAREERGTVVANARTLDPAMYTCNPNWHTCMYWSEMLTYCGDPCGNTAAQYYTCAPGCVWP